jgi:hypothetical protein
MLKTWALCQPPTEKQEGNPFKIPDTHIYSICSPLLPVTHLPPEKAEPHQMSLSNGCNSVCSSAFVAQKTATLISPVGWVLGWGDTLPTTCYSSLIISLFSSGAEPWDYCAPGKMC